jgi:hypothetical protein
MRVVNMVRVACASLNLAAFEWSIASGLVRCGVEGTTALETLDRLHAASHTGYATGHDSTMLPLRRFTTAANLLRR